MLLVTILPTPLHAAELSDDLIAATENEGKSSAVALHQHHLKLIEIEDKGIDLNDGTMLGGKYRYDLNALASQANSAFSQLQARVQSITGNRDDSKKLAQLIATHWRREMYGFGSAEELAQQLSTRRRTAWILVILVCLGLGSIAKRMGKPEENNTPLKVPADLMQVAIQGTRYQVAMFTGLVLDKEMWNEVKSTTLYHQGTFGKYPSEVITESVRKGKTFMLTMNGKEVMFNLTGSGHNFRPGNIVTYLLFGRGKKQNAVVAYNHATEKTEEQIGMDIAHGTYWKLNLVITGSLAFYAFNWASTPMQRLGVENGFGILAQSVGVAILFTGLVHFLHLWRRNRRFRKTYKPRFEKFLRDGDGDIKEIFQKLISKV